MADGHAQQPPSDAAPRPAGTAQRPPGSARAAALVCAAVILAGMLALLASYMLHREKPIAGTPAPTALFHATLFPLKPGSSACMSPLTLPPDGRVLQLVLGEGPAGAESPPIDVLLTAPGYRALAHLAGGQAEGNAQLTIRPPRHFVIGSACLINRGSTPAPLAGSTEARSVSRVRLTIGGRPAAGDIALTFLGRRQTRLSRLGDVFEHASNLTDRLVPSSLIWLIVAVAILIVPVAAVRAIHAALREDDPAL
jgi:hypothetical protein